ncbi:hypothetical protein SAMN05192553_104358 [Cyclobacterium xiamenense]|uniref:Uncharacterized protein n=1 Tax=Cyclobacterium xiamenense TaxID=1297121 RepID=A0A1H6ZM59_9BACT|nr:hypothetical protein [Cyclobacterium xiamenense]SEJ50670.1 hypothetical protein SAMN05192553_104358 [Cyclobacterium xiamenense]
MKKLKVFLDKFIFKINILLFGPLPTKQELLIKKALREKGFNIKKLKIRCDHNLGFNYINGIQIGVKYPDSFYEEAVKLIPESKAMNFYFNGKMNESGQRFLMLKPFTKFEKTCIIASEEGRVQNKKDQFNSKYFAELADAKFGFCPHQADWNGDKDFLWTYRFIECCFVETIPVLFKETPLSDKFVDGFNFVWNDELLNLDSISQCQAPDPKTNRLLAKERFCLTDDECKRILETL